MDSMTNTKGKKKYSFALDPDKSTVYPLLITFIELDGVYHGPKMKEMLTAVLRETK